MYSYGFDELSYIGRSYPYLKVSNPNYLFFDFKETHCNFLKFSYTKLTKFHPFIGVCHKNVTPVHHDKFQIKMVLIIKISKNNEIFERKTSEKWLVKSIIKTNKNTMYDLLSIETGECLVLSKDEIEKQFESKQQVKPENLNDLLTRMALYGPF